MQERYASTTSEWFANSGTQVGNERLVEWLEAHGESTAVGIILESTNSNGGKPVAGYPFSGKLLADLILIAKSDWRLKIRIYRRRSRTENLELCDFFFYKTKFKVQEKEEVNGTTTV